ncbi:trypsin-like serine protease [Ramicandelaber brevisporus]|nr:trypsin-like serine protease [Ramicandelaber brevisporus]
MRSSFTALLLASFAVGSVIAGPITRIINGTPVREGEAPFAAYIYAQSSEEGGGSCTGSIISPNHILTAAHCLITNATNVCTSNITVITGATNIQVQSAGAAKHTVKSYTIHPMYQFLVKRGSVAEKYPYDIAVIELSKPIQFNNATKPIKLFPATRYKPQTVVTVCGWGRTSGDPTSELSSILLKGSNVIVSREVCNKRKDLTYEDNGGQLCTVSSQSISCQGDSGGPLYISIPHTGNQTEMAANGGKNEVATKAQVGVVSFGEVGCAVGTPDYFISPAYHWQFITYATGLEPASYLFNTTVGNYTFVSEEKH